MAWENRSPSGFFHRYLVNWHALLTLGVVVLFHRDDYISLFVSCFDIPVSLDNLFQRIASVYDRLYLSRFNQLFEEH